MDFGKVDANPIAIFDFGSINTRIGFAGEDSPKITFPSVIANTTAQELCGQEAVDYKYKKTLYYPIERGTQTNFDRFLMLWKHAYSKLQIAPEETPLIILEKPIGPKANREKTTQIAFEELSVPSFFLISHHKAAISFLGDAELTGCVVDIGYGVTWIVPMYDGYALYMAMEKIYHGGNEITQNLQKILVESGKPLLPLTVVENIKRKLAFVSRNFDEDLKKSFLSNEFEAQYQLPDGKFITLSQERFRCSEPLFQPKIFGFESSSIEEAIDRIIFRIDIDLRDKVASNILLVGGSSLFPGIEERLRISLKKMQPNRPWNIIAPKDRDIASWRGASQVANMIPMITREEYEESGPSIIHRRDF